MRGESACAEPHRIIRNWHCLQPWSNGQVEAQITKLRLVRRQMYGRAKLDLLQARLIGAL